MNLLTVSGSLRAASSNARALAAATLLASTSCTVRAAVPIDHLPHFNPDVETAGLPDMARLWRDQIAWADAVIVSSPEYAHGVPGALKNALDWLVGGIEITDKPIALLNATPPAEYAHAQLRETLTVMGGRIVDDACVQLPLRGRTIDAAAIASDPSLRGALILMLDALATAVESRPAHR